MNVKRKLPIRRTERINVRMYTPVKAAIHAIAQQRGITVTEVIEQMVIEALRREGVKLDFSATRSIYEAYPNRA